MSAIYHPNNPIGQEYNFEILEKAHPILSDYIKEINQRKTIDFGDPKAILALNTALLKHYYKVVYWEFPQQNLCPPIPSRADYLYHVNDLIVPNGHAVVLDVGVGANCIYPLIGTSAFDWQFIGSDVSKDSLTSAKAIVDNNTHLASKIILRQQKEVKFIFKNVIAPNDYIHATVCNPPFHASAAAAQKANTRKVQNLGTQKGLNFGGKDHELYCDGGEMGFLKQMVYESQFYKTQVGWFTSLVSKKENIRPLKVALKKVGCATFKVIPMQHGNKQTRILAWTFSL